MARIISLTVQYVLSLMEYHFSVGSPSTNGKIKFLGMSSSKIQSMAVSPELGLWDQTDLNLVSDMLCPSCMTLGNCSVFSCAKLGNHWGYLGGMNGLMQIKHLALCLALNKGQISVNL